MKMQNVVSSLLVIGLATTVTAGSMYITVRASVLQEAGDLPQLDAEPANAQEAVETPASSELLAEARPALDPEDVRHDRSHKIVLDASGGFTGRIISNANPAAGYTVHLIQNGVPVGMTDTDSSGRFSFSGLQPGVCGILGFSENGLVLYGAHLVGMNQGPAGEVELDVDSAVVSGADVGAIRQMIMAATPTEEIRFTEEVTAEVAMFPYGEGEPASSIVNQPVELDADGSLRGVVNVLDPRTGRHCEVRDITVHFLQGGRVVGTAVVEPTGDFVISGLVPGVYSVVGTGKDGVFAIGIDVVGAGVQPAFNPASGDATPVSLRKAHGGFAIAAVRGLSQYEEELAECLPEEMCPFGAAYGGGGGGFGGGGGGGFPLGLLGLAGLAGLAGLDGGDDAPASPGI